MTDPLPYQPTVEEVAALIRARTKERGGGGAEAGTFNDATKPTAEQAETLIRLAVRRVATRIGGIQPCNENLIEDARSCAALYAAMLVEQSYYPEQTTNAGSSFKNLESMWKEQIKDLGAAVAEECGEGIGSGEGAGADTHPRSKATFDERQLIGPNGPIW